MQLSEINKAIAELEGAPTSYANCEKLASLYIVRNNLSEDVVVQEYSDILPSYSAYAETKAMYQKHQISVDTLLHASDALCKEICEFLQTLYNNTECSMEREKLKSHLASVLSLL